MDGNRYQRGTRFASSYHYGAQNADVKVRGSHNALRNNWVNNDDQHHLNAQKHYNEDRQAQTRNVRETRPKHGSHSATTEQDMDIDSSEDTHGDTFSMKNIAELLLKLDDLPTLIQNSKQEVRTLKQSLSTRVSDETMKLKEDIEKLKMENQTLKARDQDRSSQKRDEEKLKNLEHELQLAIEEKEKYETTLRELIPKYQEANVQIKALEESVTENKHNMNKITSECETAKEKLSSFQRSYQQVMDEKTKVEKELSESKTRLSRLMGNKLGDNNPDIADLSDKNRPTKLAEKNNELYDNEWTDAFEFFQTHYSSEKETIEKLLQMLQDIKAECDKIAKEQEQKLKEAMKLKRSRESLQDHVYKQLKDFRRFTAEESLPEVIQICLKEVQNKEYGPHLFDADVLRFFKGCVELCWFMNVQDPPLVFGDTPRKYDLFDTNNFKYYTTTGSHYDYMVWPALLLTKDGALLSKGVAQASKEHYSDSRNYRNVETRRNGAGSASNAYGSNEQQTHKNVGLHTGTDTTKTHISHYNDRFSSNRDYRNVYYRNYGQSVVTGSDHSSDKTGFLSQTVKERESSTVASRMSKNFGTSHRYVESDKSRKQALRPRTPRTEYMTKFIGLVSLYGINSEETIEAMGESYHVCKDYYNYKYGHNSTESDV